MIEVRVEKTEYNGNGNGNGMVVEVKVSVEDLLSVLEFLERKAKQERGQSTAMLNMLLEEALFQEA